MIFREALDKVIELSMMDGINCYCIVKDEASCCDAAYMVMTESEYNRHRDQALHRVHVFAAGAKIDRRAS